MYLTDILWIYHTPIHNMFLHIIVRKYEYTV